MSGRERAELEWTDVDLIEVLDHARGRTIDGEQDGEAVYFTDGSAVEVFYDEGYAYSDVTFDPARVVIRIGLPKDVS